MFVATILKPVEAQWCIACCNCSFCKSKNKTILIGVYNAI